MKIGKKFTSSIFLENLLRKLEILSTSVFEMYMYISIWKLCRSFAGFRIQTFLSEGCGSRLWNVNIKGDGTPIFQFLSEERRLTSAGSLLLVANVPPARKIWEMVFSSGYNCLANTDGSPNDQVKLGWIMSEQWWCQVLQLEGRLLFIFDNVYVMGCICLAI